MEERIIWEQVLSSRVKSIDESGIRKIFDLVKGNTSLVNMSIGEPDYDISVEIKEASISAILSGKNKYTPNRGNPFLIAALEKMLAQTSINYEDIIITSGVSGGLDTSLRSILDIGDEVIIADPSFVSYKYLTLLCGGKAVYMKEDASDLESKISSRTKTIIINNPSNPTGKLYSRSELLNIAKIAKKHNLLVLSDEIYDEFVYDEKFVSMGELYSNALVLKGFSKNYAMTGWRLGYALGPKDLLKEMVKIQQYTYVCAPSFAQEAAITALTVKNEDHINQFKQRRDMIYNELKNHYEMEKPGGTYYIFPAAPNMMTGSEFVKKAIENGLLVVPGGVFSQIDDHFRISYAVEDKTLEKGIKILKSLV